MLSQLLAYDAAGNVIATLDYVVAKDADGNVTGLIDFAAHEAAGGKLRDIWNIDSAVGSGTWPEWIGARAHDFTVDLGADTRISALVHKVSGHRRERAAVEAAIASAPVIDGAKDLRAILGGPTAPLVLDEEGRTIGRSGQGGGTPAHLPVIGRQVAQEA